MNGYYLTYDYFKTPYEPEPMGRTQKEEDLLADLITAAEQANATLDVLPEDVQSEYETQYAQLIETIERLRNKE